MFVLILFKIIDFCLRSFLWAPNKVLLETSLNNQCCVPFALVICEISKDWNVRGYWKWKTDDMWWQLLIFSYKIASILRFKSFVILKSIGTFFFDQSIGCYYQVPVSSISPLFKTGTSFCTFWKWTIIHITKIEQPLILWIFDCPSLRGIICASSVIINTCIRYLKVMKENKSSDFSNCDLCQ